jgi:hypothetical protein
MVVSKGNTIIRGAGDNLSKKKSNLFMYFSFLVMFLYPFFGLLWASKYGKAAFDLQYDDVAYAIDAQWRLAELHLNGIVSFWHQLATQPPHSPVSTFLGMIGIQILGDSAIGFYGGNTLLVWASSILLFLTLRDLTESNVKSSILSLLMFLSPFTLIMLTDSRPDMGNGFFTGLICLQILTLKNLNKPKIQALCILTFTLAFSSKLTTIPATLVLTGISIVIRIVLSNSESRKETVAGLFKIFTLAAIVLSPLIYFQFQSLIDYYHASFSSPTGLSASNTLLGVSFWSALKTYYSWGYQRLGGFFTPSVLILLLIIIPIKRIRFRREMISISLLALISYCIICFVRIRNPYLFSPLHAFTIILLILICINFPIEKANFFKQKKVAFVLIILCLLSASQVTKFASYINDPTIITKTSINSMLINGLDDVNPDFRQVYTTVVSNSNSATLNWKATTLNSKQTFVSDDYNLLPLDNFLNYEFVLVPNMLRVSYNKVIQSGVNLPKVLDNLRASNYGLVSNSKINATGYYLFKKNQRSPIPWIVSTGQFKGVEGPYPRYGLMQQFQWSIDHNASVCFATVRGIRYLFSGSLFVSQGDIVRINLGGEKKDMKVLKPMSFMPFKIGTTAKEDKTCINLNPEDSGTAIALATSISGLGQDGLGSPDAFNHLQ